MKYTYTALFIPQKDGIGYICTVPDLPGCLSSGRNLDEAIDQITDAAGGWLCVAEDESLDIPDPTPQSRISHDPPAVMSLIRIDTVEYRAKTDTRAVRKNVSLPAWMASLADKKNINCSQVLQEGLLSRFNAG